MNESGRLRRSSVSEYVVRPGDGRAVSVDVRQLALELSELMDRRPWGELRTLSELAEEWLPRKLRGLESAKSLEGRVRNHLLPALGGHTSATLRAKHVEDLMQELLASGLSPQTVNHVRDAGRQLVAWAIKNDEWASASQFAQTDPLEIPARDVDVLTGDEAARLLLAVDERWLNLFAVAIYLGPRRGELFALRREWVDLGALTVGFCGSHGRSTTKTGGRRTGIPIPTELLPYIISALERSRGSEYLFPSANGGRIQRDTKLCAILRRALERAGIQKRLTFHGLRRVSSCLHQEAGCHPWVVSQVLGHSQASLAMMGGLVENTTARHYTKFSEEFVRRELGRLSLGEAMHAAAHDPRLRRPMLCPAELRARTASHLSLLVRPGGWVPLWVGAKRLKTTVRSLRGRIARGPVRGQWHNGELLVAEADLILSPSR